MAIIGILSSIAIPKLTDVIEKARVARAIGDLRTIAVELLSLEDLPATLAGINRLNMLDPWGNPYEYLRFDCTGNSGGGGQGGGQGQGGSGNSGGCSVPGARKDRFLVPINSMFDLYSKGKDGNSAPPLTASASQDDIVVANDGGFIGMAKNY
jgi:general secretion pathway protein G